MLIPRSVLATLPTHADIESSRYALGVLLIERAEDGRPRAVATDGRRMAVIEWTEPETSGDPEGLPYLLPIDAAVTAAKAMKPRLAALKKRPNLAFVPFEQNGEGTGKLAPTNGQDTADVAAPPVDGRFPAWRDVIPETGPETGYVSVRLDPRYLAEAAQLLNQVACSEDSRAVTVHIQVPDDDEKRRNNGHSCAPIVLEKHNPETGTTARVVIMPLGDK